MEFAHLRKMVDDDTMALSKKIAFLFPRRRQGNFAYEGAHVDEQHASVFEKSSRTQHANVVHHRSYAHLKNNPSPCDLGEAKYSRNKVFHKIFLDTPLTQLRITWLRQKYNTACQRLHQIALPTAEHT